MCQSREQRTEEQEKKTEEICDLSCNMQLLKELAEKGDIDAQARLGNNYFYGFQTKKNQTAGEKWLLFAAKEEHHPAGFWARSLCYLEKIGTYSIDLEKAFVCLQKSAEQNYAPAQNCLAGFYCMYYAPLYEDMTKNRLTEVERDKKKEEAVKLLRLAAEQGCAHAEYNLAFCFENGRGTKKDISEALRLYHLAAKHECVSAQYYLGFLYEQGVMEEKVVVLEKNKEEAIRFYLSAAKKGDIYAQHALMEMDGGCPVSDKSDSEKFRRCDSRILARQYDRNYKYATWDRLFDWQNFSDVWEEKNLSLKLNVDVLLTEHYFDGLVRTCCEICTNLEKKLPPDSKIEQDELLTLLTPETTPSGRKNNDSDETVKKTFFMEFVDPEISEIIYQIESKEVTFQSTQIKGHFKQPISKKNAICVTLPKGGPNPIKINLEIKFGFLEKGKILPTQILFLMKGETKQFPERKVVVDLHLNKVDFRKKQYAKDAICENVSGLQKAIKSRLEDFKRTFFDQEHLVLVEVEKFENIVNRLPSPLNGYKKSHFASSRQTLSSSSSSSSSKFFVPALSRRAQSPADLAAFQPKDDGIPPPTAEFPK